jgi:zinc protease
MENFYQGVVSHKFDNGLDLVFKHYPGEIVGIAIFVGAGSGDEGKCLGSGLAHLTEHLTFEGRKDLEEELRALGVNSNAYTTFDHTLYFLEVPRENWKKALEIFISALFKPEVTPEIFERERQVVLKEEKFRDDEPGSLIFKLGFEHSYINHPYKQPVIGHSYLLNKLTLQDFKNFHALYYTANNTVISIIGDLEFSEVEKEVMQVCGDLNPGFVHKNFYPDEERNFPVFYRHAYPGELTYVFISFSGISVFDNDLQALDMLADYLSQGKDSPLYQKFVKTGLCYTISCTNYTPFLQGQFVFFAVLDPKNYDAFKKEFENFITEFKSTRLNPQRIERLKTRLIYEMLRSQEGVLRIAQNLARDQGITGEFRFPLAYLKKFLRLTVKDIQEVAGRYLNPETSCWVELVPQKEKPSLPKSTLNLEFEKLTLDNGLRIILSPRNISGIVAITALFEGGVRIEDDKTSGISQLLVRSVITPEIQEKFEQLGGKISPVSGNNTMGFEVEVLSQNLIPALNLLADLMMEPEIDPQEFKIQKNIQIGKLRDLEIDLFYQASKLLRSSLFGNHPYHNTVEGSYETISGLKIETLRQYTHKYFVPDNCVVSVVGEFDIPELKSQLEKLFKNWKKGELKISLSPPQSPDQLIFKEKKIPQREVVLEVGFIIPGLNTICRYQADILQTLVSGQGSLFFNKIRRALGASYTLGGGMMIGPETGALIFYVATTPENKHRVRDKIIEIINQLRAGDIKNEEIEDAKKLLLTRYNKELIESSSYGFHLSLEELLGKGAQEYRNYPHKIRGITKKDLIDFINKYIDPSKCVMVEVGNI